MILTSLLSLLLLVQVPDNGTRYLSLENIPKAKHEKYLKTTAFVLNSLSKNKKIGEVKLDGSNINFNLNDFGIDPKIYDELEHPYKDMRADWFINNVLESPVYYKLLGANDWKSFKKLINYDEDSVDELKQKRSALAPISGVTSRNRYISRTEYDGGVIWETKDMNSSVGEKEFLQNLLLAKYDSREIIARLPNGLLAYYILDEKNRKLNHVDPDIAIDPSTKSLDKRVYAAKTCIMCHATGIIPVDDKIKLTPKIEDVLVKRDQDNFSKVLDKINGLTPHKNIASLKEIMDDYYKPLDKDAAINELGITGNEFDTMVKTTKSVVVLRLQVGLTVRRETWEDEFKKIKLD